MARYPEGVDLNNAGWNMTCQWFWPNQCLSIPFEKEMENFFTDMWEAPKKAVFSNAMGFNFDSAPVFDQMTACNAVVDEYRLALLYGQFEDVEGANAKIVEELKAAGIDEVIAEEQRQFDEFLAARDDE